MELGRNWAGRVSPLARWRQAAAVTIGTALILLVVLALRYELSRPFVAGVAIAALGYTGMLIHADRRHRISNLRMTGRITPATVVTAVRAGGAVALAGFLTVPRPEGMAAWLPALLFGGAALFDSVDGFIARTTDTSSAFGARIDVETDALALLVGTAVAVRFGEAPLVFLAVGIARYGFLAGLVIRRIRELPVSELPPRRSRRVLGAVGMVATFLILSPPLGPPLSRLLALAVTVVLLGGFVRDWLLVTRRV